MPWRIVENPWSFSSYLFVYTHCTDPSIFQCFFLRLQLSIPPHFFGLPGVIPPNETKSETATKRELPLLRWNLCNFRLDGTVGTWRSWCGLILDWSIKATHVCEGPPKREGCLERWNKVGILFSKREERNNSPKARDLHQVIFSEGLRCWWCWPHLLSHRFELSLNRISTAIFHTVRIH